MAESPLLSDRKDDVHVGLTDLAGTAAVVSSLFFVWPQVARLVRTRDPEGISVVGALWPMAGFSLWSAYGLDKHLYPIVIANAQALVGFTIVLVLRVCWGHRITARMFWPSALVAAGLTLVIGATAPAPIVGLAALTIGATSFLPQARVALRTTDCAGVSAATYCLLTVSASLWILYGLLRWDALVIAPNLLIVPTAALIAVKALRAADQPGPGALQTTLESNPSAPRY